LKLEPGAAAEERGGSGDTPAHAPELALAIILLPPSRLISHFQLGNEVRADRGTAASGTLGGGVDSPSHTILVVDDDASIRFLCRVNLELERWTVREAATITSARAILSEEAVAVVLLDVHVGTQSGAEFLAEVRRDHPGLPVAMLTGSVGATAFDEHAADAVIPKPFRLEQLTDTVRRLAALPAQPAR
jgi:CheY-like chemotaxis protein